MVRYESRNKYFKTIKHRTSVLSLCVALYSVFSFAQKTSSTIDSTSIKVGQELIYSIEIETDTSSLVVFPEGQTFLPLEMIESYNVDAIKFGDRFKLTKKYGLTQFDSGTYTIPRQKILIGDFEAFTDSLKVEVKSIEVDTTKQPLYSIKPIIEVDKSPSKWWLYFLIIILSIAIIGFLLYWFIWREKPLTEDEKVALLPPYERAKLALVELDKSGYLQNEEIKEYYSELTGIIRKYLDEKVYDHALESTTDELINRLHLLKDGNQIDLSKEDIKNIDTILRRADLVKFAKSKPDKELAVMDRNTIDMEIDHVKEALPEPTEEELLADLKYQEELEEKRRKRKIVITIAASVLILIATYIGFGMYFGFKYVKDTIFGDSSLELLEEKDWVTSEYGAPGVIITTPKVLERKSIDLPEDLKTQMQVATFGYGNASTNFDIAVISTKMASTEPPGGNAQKDPKEGENKIDLIQVAEGHLKSFESQGTKNIITKNEQFITPNGQEGLKTYGTADFVTETGEEVRGNYVILGFTTQNLLQEVILVWEVGDVYADQIMERILNSIELIKIEDEE